MIERRGFLTGLVSSLAAPALIGPGLVKCRNIIRPVFDYYTLCYQIVQSPDGIGVGEIRKMRIPLIAGYDVNYRPPTDFGIEL